MDENSDKTTNLKPLKLRNGCLTGIAIIVVIGIIGSMGSSKEEKISKKTLSEVGITEYVKASSQDIFAAYDANELSAAKFYGDRPLEVTGTIQSIDESFGNPVLSLSTSNQFMPLRANFENNATDALSKMAKGDKVHVRCDRLTETAGFLSLQDCFLM